MADEDRRRVARDRARERWIRRTREALGEPTEDEIRRAKLDQRLRDLSFQWPSPYSTEQLAKIAQLLKADTADSVVKSVVRAARQYEAHTESVARRFGNATKEHPSEELARFLDAGREAIEMYHAAQQAMQEFSAATSDLRRRATVALGEAMLAEDMPFPQSLIDEAEQRFIAEEQQFAVPDEPVERIDADDLPVDDIDRLIDKRPLRVGFEARAEVMAIAERELPFPLPGWLEDVLRAAEAARQKQKRFERRGRLAEDALVKLIAALDQLFDMSRPGKQPHGRPEYLWACLVPIGALQAASEGKALEKMLAKSRKKYPRPPKSPS